MDVSIPSIQSQITFLYYDALESAHRFYHEVLGLRLVADQGWAKIYRTADQAFVGVVRADRGYHRPRQDSAVLVTLVVEDVDAWYEYLEAREVTLLTEVKDMADIAVRGFFLKDPGGYTIEIQQFLDPYTALRFG